MELKPTRGKIFAQILTNEETTKSGIIIKGKIHETPLKAKVIELGDPPRYCMCWEPKREKNRFKDNGLCLTCNKPLATSRSLKGQEIPWVCKKGDTVHFKKGFGKRCRIEEKDYIFLKLEELIGVER